MGLNSIGLVLSLSSFIFATIKLKTADKHKVFGIIATILALLQPLNALVRPPEAKASEQKTVWRVVWEQGHHWNGRAALAFAAAAVFTGIDLGAKRGAYSNAQKWKRAFGGLMLALVLIWAALFARHRLMLRKQRGSARREIEEWPPQPARGLEERVPATPCSSYGLQSPGRSFPQPQSAVPAVRWSRSAPQAAER
jgi:hypothetical protein